ncbi:MAG: CHAD domain-containing protein [Gammaproteobacteria bacterium]|nr:CHAD domain-containing protein [Gammaproteobacteria bacterium]
MTERTRERAGGADAARADAPLLVALRAESDGYECALRAARSGRQGDVHALRIATRRMLALVEFAAALAPSGKWPALVRELRRPFRRCARLRDLQTMRARLRRMRDAGAAPRAALQAMLDSLDDSLRRRRDRTIAQLAAARPRRTCRRIMQLAAARLAPDPSAVAVRACLDRSRQAVRAACRRMCKGGMKALHRARVAIKACRYQFELAPALGARVRPAELRVLRSLQKQLGAITDLELLRRETKQSARRHPGRRRALGQIRRRIGRESEQRRARVLAAAGRGDIVAAPGSG